MGILARQKHRRMEWKTKNYKINTLRAEARRTTILQPMEQKPHSQKDRQDEKAQGYAPAEGTR